MSPAALRRYRAERMLTDEFQALKGTVCGKVTRRLLRDGVNAERIDVEGCYALAWNGLYAVVSGGKRIENPAGWLVNATYRRAIDEHRLRCHDWPSLPRDAIEQGLDRDFAQEIEDRARLRQLFEAMRGRLGTRERQAASLCYLQGLSRAEAADRMGISERHMKRLMEGRSRARPGVATKLGALAATIAEGEWCEEQGSLIRALAFGVLSPDSERHELAMAHARECSACRSYVTSVRGLAAVLPPVFLPLAPGTLVGVGGGAAMAGGAAISGASTATGGSAASVAATGSGLGGGAPVASSLGAKVAVAGLVAAGIGAGGVDLAVHSPGRAIAAKGQSAHAPQPKPTTPASMSQRPSKAPAATEGATGHPTAASSKPTTPASSPKRGRAPARRSPTTKAGERHPAANATANSTVKASSSSSSSRALHEFGPEHDAPGAGTHESKAPEHGAEQEFGVE